MLEKKIYQKRPLRYEYELTQKGLDLGPVILWLLHWGNKHYENGDAQNLSIHDTCSRSFNPVMICSECGEPVDPEQVINKSHEHSDPLVKKFLSLRGG